MKKLVFVNGSLRGASSASLAFLKAVEARLGTGEAEIRRIAVTARPDGGFSAEAAARLSEADAIVIAFPLFSYCLPGALMAFLEEWHSRTLEQGKGARGPRVYAIVNCGYPEPSINAEALRVIANFCKRLGLDWRYALAFGCGPIIKAFLGLPLAGAAARKALAALAEDLIFDEGGLRSNILVAPPLPKGLIFWIRDTFFLRRQVTA